MMMIMMMMIIGQRTWASRSHKCTSEVTACQSWPVFNETQCSTGPSSDGWFLWHSPVDCFHPLSFSTNGKASPCMQLEHTMRRPSRVLPRRPWCIWMLRTHSVDVPISWTRRIRKAHSLKFKAFAFNGNKVADMSTHTDRLLEMTTPRILESTLLGLRSVSYWWDVGWKCAFVPDLWKWSHG